MKAKRRSVAHRLMARTLLVLILVMAALLTATFFSVKSTIVRETRKFSKATATLFADSIAAESERQGVPIDVKFGEEVKRLGNYVCTWYGVDYAYVYTINEAEDGITYITATCNAEKFGAEEAEDFAERNMGRATTVEIAEGELAVWHAEGTDEPLVYYYKTNNDFGHEYCTVLRQYDQLGNKIMVGVDMSYYDIYRDVMSAFAVVAGIILVVLVFAGTMVYLVVERRVSRPANAIATAMDEFITDGDRVHVTLDEHIGDDEFNRMAVAFNQMTADIDEYVENIGTLNRNRERQETELEIAAHIQRGIMPKEHLLSRHYEMHTLMKPARNMGGDLYDYTALDDNRVFVVIADVSGKGVPAAIFMSVTFTVIHQLAEMGLSPAEILSRANEHLCRNNPAMLFVTALVGVYDKETNEFTYANAGHDRPYIVGDGVHKLDELGGTMLGLFPGETYSEKTVTLETGETLFLYTDGVTEAVSERKEFFGLERLETLLAEAKTNRADNLVTYVYDALTAFVGGEEQHDDITMLALTAKTTTELSLHYEVREFEKIKEEIFKAPLSDVRRRSFCLAAEECFVNICSYAFGDAPPPTETIGCTVTVSDRFALRFTDGGAPFNPIENVEEPVDYDIKTRVGGLGRYLATQSVDDITYAYENGKNVLTLIDYIKEEEQ